MRNSIRNLKRKVKAKRYRRKLEREWKALPVSAWPLEYTGPSIPGVKGLPGLLKGSPLARVRGPKGARGAVRVVDTHNIERAIPADHVERRW